MHLFRSMALQMGAFESIQAAYDDFEVYAKQEKIPHSQRRFTHRMLYKRAHGAYLATKGWNARVLAEWLRDVVNRIALQQPTVAPRKLRMVPEASVDPRLRPTCIAMFPGPMAILIFLWWSCPFKECFICCFANTRQGQPCPDTSTFLSAPLDTCCLDDPWSEHSWTHFLKVFSRSHHCWMNFLD